MCPRRFPNFFRKLRVSKFPSFLITVGGCEAARATFWDVGHATIPRVMHAGCPPARSPAKARAAAEAARPFPHWPAGADPGGRGSLTAETCGKGGKDAHFAAGTRSIPASAPLSAQSKQNWALKCNWLRFLILFIYLSICLGFFFIYIYACTHTYTRLKAQLQLCSGSKSHTYQESCCVQGTRLGHFHFQPFSTSTGGTTPPPPPKAQQRLSSPFVPRVGRTRSPSLAQGLPPCISCIWVRRVVT